MHVYQNCYFVFWQQTEHNPLSKTTLCNVRHVFLFWWRVCLHTNWLTGCYTAFPKYNTVSSFSHSAESIKRCGCCLHSNQSNTWQVGNIWMQSISNYRQLYTMHTSRLWLYCRRRIDMLFDYFTFAYVCSYYIIVTMRPNTILVLLW